MNEKEQYVYKEQIKHTEIYLGIKLLYFSKLYIFIFADNLKHN